ncbi:MULTISPECIES: DUF2345 domain-containing protein [unclassified Gilliamella]|uniref:DUF2345 domain-containing protein n=1 Tax=unclassified Gilliamella TaxID=2685620 RepID=UPI00226AAB20|nr:MULTISPECIES: DUF2345 domain-containing protein [unclassified Gilliamella]MCX8587157.1 DUF2345 domain-containing protein [Gilliamella sp. B3801]MCX8592089.1 DUF2345 domain-containing protein [Gilliamella sp. B3804]
MKLFANQGKVEIQAQNDELDMAAKQDIKVDSVDGSITITASKDITLICGGSYIKISGDGIELGTSGNVSVKSAALQKMGVATLNAPVINLPNVNGCSEFFILTNHETGEPLAFHPYDIEVNGQVITGVTDAKGHTQRIFTDEPQTITGTPQDNSPKNTFLARHIASGKRVQLDFNES